MAGFMPLGDFKVTYTNGETAEAMSNFRGLVEIERRWPGAQDAPGIEAIGVAVYYYLGCPGGDFDAWLETVHLIEPANVESSDNGAETVDTADPTQAAPGAA